MNSFLQILLHIPTFLPKLKEICYNNFDENTLAFKLIKLSEYPFSTNYLKEIKKTIAKSFPKYGLYEQNDTQNFAIDFIDTLISEIKKEISFTSESNEEEDNFQISKIEDNLNYKKSKYKEFISSVEKTGQKTFIEDLFLFIDSSIRYKGPLIIKNNVKFDLLLNIELTFPMSGPLKENYSLYELLDIKYKNYKSILKEKDIINNNINIKNDINGNEDIKNIEFNVNKVNQEEQKEEGLYNIFKNFLYSINIFRIFNLCERKKLDKGKINNKEIDNKINQISKINRENVEKPKEISKIVFLPKILIISFVRGIEGKELISSAISFDEKLDLKNYLETDLFNNNLETKYKLYTINIREGLTKTFGHCFSYVKVKNEWICYNDSFVHKKKPSFNLNSVAGLYYMNEDIDNLKV